MITLIFLSLALALSPAQASQLSFVRSELSTETPNQLISLVDMTGDGSLELALFSGFGLRVLGFDAHGSLQPEPLANFSWEAESVAWTLVDIDGDGVVELVTYEDAERAVVHNLGAGGFTHRTILEHKADLPRGTYRMDFLRDVDADGRQDLVLPQLGKFAIFLQRDKARWAQEGRWSEPLMIQYETRVELDVGSPSELGSEFGQGVSIPWFGIRDADGDGIQDLVSETSTMVRFHLGTPEISALPSWTLDLSALRDELPKSEGLDFDNLLGLAARGAEWKLADLDGELPNELVLRIGSKFRIYKGGSRSGALGSPSQVLKSSGNVLFFIMRDVLGDAAPELQILRGERIGLGQVIRWLVLPGSIDFDVFTYENQAGTFSRRPTRRNKLTLGIPRILAFSERMQELSEESEEQSAIPARRIALDSDAREDDVLDVLGDEVLIFLNCAEPLEAKAEAQTELVDANSAVSGFLEAHVDELGDSGSKSFDLADVEHWFSFAGAKLRESCAEKTAAHRIPLGSSLLDVRIRILDINHNGRPDFIVLGHPAPGKPDEEPSPLWKLFFFLH